jgi:hypothetical protein
VIGTGQKAVKPTSIYVIRVPWFLAVLMMDKVGDRIDLFRDDFNDKVFDNKSKKGIAKTKPSVTAVSMKVHSPVGAHQDHAIKKPQG